MSKRIVIENGERIVHFERAPGTPLTAKERKQLEALATMTDDQIDYSDIPSVPEEEWLKNGVRGRTHLFKKRGD